MAELTPSGYVTLYKDEVAYAEVPVYDIPVSDIIETEANPYYYYGVVIPVSNNFSIGIGTWRLGNKAWRLSRGLAWIDYYVGTWDGEYHFPENPSHMTGSSSVTIGCLARGSNLSLGLCIIEHTTNYTKIVYYEDFPYDVTLSGYNPQRQGYFGLSTKMMVVGTNYISGYIMRIFAGPDRDFSYDIDSSTWKEELDSISITKKPDSDSFVTIDGNIYPLVIDIDGSLLLKVGRRSSYPNTYNLGVTVGAGNGYELIESNGENNHDFRFNRFKIQISPYVDKPELVFKLRPLNLPYISDPDTRDVYVTGLQAEDSGVQYGPAPLYKGPEFITLTVPIETYLVGSLYIEPNLISMSNGDVEKFTLYSKTNKDTVIEVPAEWEIFDYYGSDVSDVATISNDGIVSIIGDRYCSITVKAIAWDRSVTTTIYVNGADPYNPGGSSGPSGGGGPGLPGGSGIIDDTTHLIPIGSSNPNVARTGLFTMYAVDAGGLSALGAALYTETILQNIGKEIMSFLWNSPIEGVISLTMFPFGVGQSGGSGSGGKLKLGSLELPISLSTLPNSSIQIHWGSVTISKTWGNFLDYAPHTKIELYLPFGTGFVQIDPHDVIDGSMTVVTNVDLVKGGCVHIVSGKYGIIGTYSGQAGVSVPVTSIDTSGKSISMVGAGIAAASAIGSASIGAIEGARGASFGQKVVTAARQNPYVQGPEFSRSAMRLGESAGKALAKPFEAISERHSKVAGVTSLAAFRTPASIARSGGFSNATGALGPKSPFVIISTPEQSVPAGYSGVIGYPCNMYLDLGSLTGYTEVACVHLLGLSCTEPELAEIDSILKGGVIF